MNQRNGTGSRNGLALNGEKLFLEPMDVHSTRMLHPCSIGARAAMET